MEQKDTFFRKLDWMAFWAATAAAFLVYFFTLGPSVGLEDSGELATAANHLGVPHPPGYPFWSMCGWMFCRVFSWVTFMGHPTPAWAMSLFSAVAGAFAAGCTAMLVCRSASDMLGERSDDRLCFAGGVGSALVFAFSPVEWSQSTIVEIYSLNALFLMWVFLLCYRWMRKPSDKILWLTAFVFGLGLTNYQVLLLAAVPLAVVIAVNDLKMFRDACLILIPVGLTYVMLSIGCMLRANQYMSSDVINKFAPVLETKSCPSSAVLALGCLLLVAAPFVGVLLRRRGREHLKPAVFTGLAGAGLLFLAATVFAGPETWTASAAEQLVAPLLEPSRYAMLGAFVAAAFALSLGAVFAPKDEPITSSRVWGWLAGAGACAFVAISIAASISAAGNAGYMGAPYSWTKANLVLVAGLVALFALAWFTPRGIAYALPVAAAEIVSFVLLEKGAMNGLTHPCSWWFVWPIVFNFLVLGWAFVALPTGRSIATAAFLAELGVSFYAYMPIVSDLRNPPMNWGYPRTWEGFKHALTRGQYEQIKMGDVLSMHFLKELGFYVKDLRTQFTLVLMAVAVAAFPLGHLFVKKENRKTWYAWLAAIGSCFLVMSFFLIALANTKGDVQDGFIQKVKFISSHGMFTLWIGYGLVFGAVFAQMLYARFVNKVLPKWVAPVLAALMLATAGIPIYENYTNDRLVFELGSAEQNGHTFGWQFGAYQLEGADQIRKEVWDKEEPLPNPLWPDRMEDHSIFFGGTDPGRFVPTYMIYSADFRPDVYLITQNALADDTYMSVERDLYGDEIWIPAKEDSAKSFDIYVREVQEGKRNANADLKIENGRVQVTGALGVMEINGILTKMMFDHERLRHSFYVEESYVIPWMYPYLTPHGLIMKIEPEQGKLSDAIVKNDMDFWDWYTRRLLHDKTFRRDFPAQKSFSKLRAAIAGLYSHSFRWRETAQAYRESVLIYPPSPEATFRYLQEVLLPHRKWNEMEDLLDYTDRVDPNNGRTAGFRDYVTRLRSMMSDVQRLQDRDRQLKGQLPPQDLIQLASCYYALGQKDGAVRTARRTVAVATNDFQTLWTAIRLLSQCDQHADAGRLTQALLQKNSALFQPPMRREAAAMLLEANLFQDADRELNAYLKTNPKDAQAWLQQAIVKDALGQVRESQQAVIEAYKADANGTLEKLRANEHLQRISAPLFRRK